MDASFILVLPLHHGDLELDSIGVSTKNHVAICHGWGAKNACASISTENLGGGLYVKGGVYAECYGITDHWSSLSIYLLPVSGLETSYIQHL